MRRRMMMGGNEDPTKINGYVKDGLVIYVDGIDKGGNDGDWHSLVGNYSFSPNNSPIELENGFQFDKSKPNYFWLRDQPFDNFGQIEIAFYISNVNSDNGILGSKQYKNRLLYINSSKKIYFNCHASNKRGTNILPIENYNTISYYSDVMLNGIKYPIVTADNYYNEQLGWAIGSCGSWRFGMTGIVYCVRYYNRALTDEERISNQLNDIRRFNLPIAINQR